MKIIIFYLKGSVDLIEMSILDLKDSNTLLSKFIKNNKPFSAVRLGLGQETYLAFAAANGKSITVDMLKTIGNTNGIYTKTGDINRISSFLRYYIQAFITNDIQISHTFHHRQIIEIQDILSKQGTIVPQIHGRVVEPFYLIKEFPEEKPWTHSLLGKKVLIISPFIESFKKQLKVGFTIDKNKPIFLEEQEFTFYKPYNTLAGNELHEDCLKTLELMINDISKINFDIALLSCGSYGPILCNLIKQKLNKSAIYMGGGLQLLFGVKGKRWETHDIISKIIENSDVPFINPSEDEQIPNYKIVENGCYW